MMTKQEHQNWLNQTNLLTKKQKEFLFSLLVFFYQDETTEAVLDDLANHCGNIARATLLKKLRVLEKLNLITFRVIKDRPQLWVEIQFLNRE